MKVIYETERLILKVFEPGDEHEAEEFWGNDEVMAHCSGATPKERLPKIIDFYMKCHEEKSLSVYAVVEKESKKVIGAAGFNVEDSTKTVELIYHFAKDSWGKGYATEAADACVNIAKSNKLVKCISASADPRNTSSLKVLEKIGFEFHSMKWFDDTKQEEPYYEMNLE